MPHTHDQFSIRFFSTFLALLLGWTVAGAQEAGEEARQDTVVYQIEQVTTIGTRYQERVIDIPYSVFSVDKKELSFGRKVSARDVLADVPGMFLQSRFGNHDLRMSLRGFGTRSNSGARSIRILVDGIPESDPDGETALDAIDFTSLGGVEVAKGNLSSLYANAPGGVINFMSELYFLRNYVGVIKQTGNHGLQQQGIKVGIHNPQNRVLFTYNYSNMDGYRQHSQEYIHLMNFAYEAYLEDHSSIGIFGNYVDGLNKLPGPLTRAEFETDPFQASLIATSQDFRRITRKGRVGIRFNTKFGEEQKTELELTFYGGFKNLERADIEFYTFAERRTIGSWARFTHRSSLGDHSNTLTLGIDYAHQAGPVTDFENLYGNKGFSVQNEFTESLNNLGVYLIDKFSLVEDRLDLVLSTRFDRNEFSRDIFIPFGKKDTSRVFNKYAPKVGLSFKIGRSVALYSSFGMSYDIPALSEIGNSNLTSNPIYSTNPDLTPQQSNSFELGMKGNFVDPEATFMPKFFFDVTFFRMTIKDEIVPFVINQRAYYRNASKTNRTGIEIGIKSHPLQHLEVALNYTFARYRYDDYVATIFSPSGTTIENYTGNTMPSIPSSIVNFIVMYEHEIEENFSAVFLWDCDYISRLYVNDRNDETAPDYFYGNILTALNVGFGDFSTVAYAGIHNIFDRRYAGFINVNDFEGRYYETGEPRSLYAGVKFNYKP